MAFCFCADGVSVGCVASSSHALPSLSAFCVFFVLFFVSAPAASLSSRGRWRRPRNARRTPSSREPGFRSTTACWTLASAGGAFPSGGCYSLHWISLLCPFLVSIGICLPLPRVKSVLKRCKLVQVCRPIFLAQLVWMYSDGGGIC